MQIRLRTAAGAAALALLGACGTPAAEVPPATAACGEVTFPPLQSGSHLIGDREPPVPYSSTPPTSGWHRSGAPPVGVFSDPLPETLQVASLEAGGVVVTHRGLDDGAVQQLVDVAQGPLGDRMVVTPYEDIDEGTVVFASWGAMQRCDGVDVDALERYVEVYGSTIESHA